MAPRRIYRRSSPREQEKLQSQMRSLFSLLALLATFVTASPRAICTARIITVRLAHPPQAFLPHVAAPLCMQRQLSGVRTHQCTFGCWQAILPRPLHEASGSATWHVTWLFIGYCNRNPELNRIRIRNPEVHRLLKLHQVTYPISPGRASAVGARVRRSRAAERKNFEL